MNSTLANSVQWAMNPEAQAQAQQMLGTGKQSERTTNAESPADKMQMTQQKHDLDMSRERMKQDHAMNMEQYKQQAALGQKYADSQFDVQKMKAQTQLQPSVARQPQQSQVAQTAMDNQYYNDAVSQVPMYLGEQFS